MPTFTTRDFAGPFRMNAGEVLKRLAGQRLQYVEIGTLEGRSACWMMQNILTNRHSRATLVDCYMQGGKKAATLAYQARQNLRPFGHRVKLHNARSIDVLPRMKPVPTFDIAYIDGDHTALGGCLDTCLAWPLVKIGGIVAFDDWTHPKFKGLHRAVAPLLDQLPHEVIAKNDQLWVRKLGVT